jgi:hypothetical protein
MIRHRESFFIVTDSNNTENEIERIRNTEPEVSCSERCESYGSIIHFRSLRIGEKQVDED